MTTQTLMAFVRGRPEVPSVVEIYVRAGPSRLYDTLRRLPVGAANLPVLDVRPDEQNEALSGKVYQWFLLELPGGGSGWARDDLLEIVGDGTRFGYGVLPTRTFAFALRRAAPPPVTTPAVAPPAPIAPAPPSSVAVPPAPGPLAMPPAPPAEPAAPPPMATPSSAPTVVVKTQSQAPTRTGPGITFPRTGVFLPRHARLPLLAVQRESGGQNYRWFKVRADGQEVWVREDLVTYDGDTDPLGLAADLYPAPMRENYWWVRGYNMPPAKDPSLPDHDGWDLGAAQGEPILAGPNGGLVVRSFHCANCTPERPSTLMHGFSLGDPRIFTDPQWGYGYGHFVIVRYSHDQLPASTRALLAARGFPGGTIFVMYAHLAERRVQDGQTLAPGQVIGTCGNTGNSEAPHLHLEVRASRSPEFSHWYTVRDGLMDPVVLFKR